MLPELKQPNIHQRILDIMSELDYIEKGQARVNGQYRFVSHDQVSAKVHPLLVKHRVTIAPSVLECTQDGNRTTVKIAVPFVNADNPSDFVCTEWYGQGIDSGDKGIGKAVSYAYKYALLKTFCLETGDDPDNNANAAYEPAKCLEFDSMIPLEMGEKERAKMKRFLTHSAQMLKRHEEDVKRDAVQRPESFFKALNAWNPKKEAA